MSSKKHKPYNDEIDLSKSINTIWKNKFTILLFTAVAIIIMYAYQITKSGTSEILFQANTKINPISTFEKSRYESYNYFIDNFRSKKFQFTKFNETYLQNLFIEKIKDHTLIANAISLSGFLDENDFNSKSDYENNVKKLTRAVKIKFQEDLSYWELETTTKNIDGWENALKYIEGSVNNEIKKYINNSFKNKITNLKKFQEFEIEDIDEKISRELINYQKKILNRVEFLKEQAKIARALNLPKETKSSIFPFAIDQSKDTYYMRGYEAIEKEMDLIQSRVDARPFIDNLIDLENKKDELYNNKQIQRIQNLFDLTPVAKSKDNFFAARLEINSTKYRQLNSITTLTQILIIAGFFGLFCGIIYVLIKNKEQKK